MADRAPGWSWVGSRFRSWLRPILILAAFSLAASGFAGTLTVENPGAGSVPLDGKWQFHLGDDLFWANPAVDDSGWEQIGADTTWGAQTHPSYAGFAWYRRHITIENSSRTQTGNLALLIPPVDDVYDLYWNGKNRQLRRNAAHGELVVVRPQRCLHSADLLRNRRARSPRLEGPPLVDRSLHQWRLRKRSPPRQGRRSRCSGKASLLHK